MGKSRNQGERQMSSGCLMLFALPFALVGVFMSGLTFLTWSKGRAAQRWVEVPARILSAELETHSDSDGSTYQAKATYEYTFAGAVYRGDRVTLHSGADNIGSFHKDAARELKTYQTKDEPFRCFVDPEDPSNAVIYRELRWGMMAFYSIFAVAFGGAGVGLLAGAFVGRKEEKAQTVRREERPNEPWLWREDWASGQVQCRSGAAAVPLTAVAIFVNAVAWPLFLSVLLPEIAKRENNNALWGLLFPAAGVLLAFLAMRSWAKRRKFGDTRFEMASVPGVIGGRLAGVIHVPRQIEAGAGFRQVLRCVRRETVRRGKDRTVRERPVWEGQRHLKGELLPGDDTRTAIPVLFGIPFDQPESTVDGGRSDIVWRLAVSAEVAGVDFEASYEVPVFKTAESSANFTLDESPLANLMSPPDPVAEFAQEGVEVEREVAGGTSYTFPPGRNRGAAMGLTMFTTIWWIVVVVLVKLKAPWLFPIVFGGFGALLTLAALSLWLSTMKLRVGSDGVGISQGWWIRGPERRIAFHEFTEVKVDSDMQMGNQRYHHVELRLGSGKSRKLTGGLRSRRLAQIIADTIIEASGGRGA